MNKHFDVAIIGGGPAGAICARELVRGGRSVVILEMVSEIKRKVCGEYLCPSGVALLKEVGLTHLVEQFLPISGMQIFALNQYHVDAIFPAHQGRQLGMAVNRACFDTKLLDCARQAGAKVELGAQVTAFRPRPQGGYVLTLKDGQVFETALLVGADGRHSFTARQLGLKEGMDTSKIALHCHLQNKSVNRRQGEMHIFSDGSYIGIDPTGEYEVNLSLVCSSQLVREEKDPRILLNRYIDQSDHLRNSYGLIGEEIKVNTITPLTNKMEEIVANDATLIGDAAGFLDPLTGEGMYIALWSGHTLACELLDDQHQGDRLSALRCYAAKKKVAFRHKLMLNRGFQLVIKTPWLIKLIAAIIKKRRRSDIFLGVIGNIYSPFEGLKRLIKIKKTT